MNPWIELAPGVLHTLYRDGASHLRMGEHLDRIDRDRGLQAKLPVFAIVELSPNAHPSHLRWILERTTGTGPLAHPRWRQPSSAGLLYGPKRAAAWRTLDAQHFGLPERRVVFVALSGSTDPAIIFEQTGGRLAP
jgi:DNA (cytosine-5)-methyltransferase 1